MDNIAIVYWSGTGNTEAMANSIAEGIKNAGAEAELFTVSSFNDSMIDKYSKLVFGCPSMGDEVLEESEFEPFFESIETKLAGKKIALFGSYGWGDGEWMRDWEERCRKANVMLFDESLIVQESPEGPECIEFGKAVAAF